MRIESDCMNRENLGFLARQLLLTEVVGDAEDTPGGCLIWGAELWAGIWQPAAIPDFEQFIVATQNSAVERRLSWRGAIILVEPASASSPAIAELEEAFYVYGFPRREGLGAGGPQMVLVLDRPSSNSNPKRLQLNSVAADDPAANELTAEAARAHEQLVAPWIAAEPSWLGGSDIAVASLDSAPVGIAALRGSPLASRTVLLWVDPAQRGLGIGRALLSFATDMARKSSTVLECVWNYRSGKLRYFFSKAGYTERLTAMYFLNESIQQRSS